MPLVSFFPEPDGARKKEVGQRLQGDLGRAGAVLFEKRRQELRLLFRQVFGAYPRIVSDADTIEYLVRGHRATREYFQKRLEQALEK